MELKNKTRSSTQLNSIVLLRGIASLMVCYYHFAGTIPHFIGPSNPLKFFAPFGKYGVEIFFIISGFILPYALHKSNYQVKNYLRFLSKRIIRIEPTYIFQLVSIIFFNLICNLNPIARSTFRFQIDLNQSMPLDVHIEYTRFWYIGGRGRMPVD